MASLVQELSSAPIGIILSVANSNAQYLSDASARDLVFTSVYDDTVADSSSDDRRILLGFGDDASERSILRVRRQDNNVETDNLRVIDEMTVSGSLTVGHDTMDNTPSGAVVDVHGDRIYLQGSGDTEYLVFSATSTGSAGIRCVSSSDAKDISNTVEFGCSPARGTFVRYNDADRVNINKTGNVGIGTSSPAALLHVSGDSLTEGSSKCSNLYVDGRSYQLNTDVPALTVVGTRSRTHKPIAEFESGTSLEEDRFGSRNIVMTINGANDGRVGVLTRDPQHALDVHGNVFTTGQYLMASDARLKTDVEELRGSLDRVRLLSGYTYNKRGRTTTHPYSSSTTDIRTEVGLIAQQVRDVLPEAVFEQKIYDSPESTNTEDDIDDVTTATEEEAGEKKDGEEYLGVSYSAVTALVLQALKELDTKVSDLENRRCACDTTYT